ncbi:3-oxo-Delta(4,5)-steroid 5-beta-reductase [Frankliniella fusca]|uniref:3-oxo-Delta(4,5)-steroid 5-beta-reductase n=1 Tax=Frankliniella fusca TaxID=407009 RepID=A0AAE1I240_9NEOP|nr:3-oxo-Delta(4,5)-steroid 5-beta-reductase [Frankliniella fusca]
MTIMANLGRPGPQPSDNVRLKVSSASGGEDLAQTSSPSLTRKVQNIEKRVTAVLPQSPWRVGHALPMPAWRAGPVPVTWSGAPGSAARKVGHKQPKHSAGYNCACLVGKGTLGNTLAQLQMCTDEKRSDKPFARYFLSKPMSRRGP